jgi:S-formylglutathione hydrolase FrmB
MKKAKILYIGFILVALILIGCSERENPADFPKINEREGLKNDGVFTYPRAYSSIENHAGWEFFNFTESKNFISKIYTPPSFRIQSTPYPILYLLHDFEGDENYYFTKMVHRIADSLIYEEEINEFYIASIDASTPYGGTWYVNNEFFGWFETMVAEQWLDFIEVTLANQLRIIDNRESRGIGGFGMGGYGALKIAAKYPGVFSSVSASNPAGSFQHIEDLIPMFIEEQGLSTPISPDDYQDMDTTNLFTEKPYTLLFFSLAQAFSPHPDEGEPGYEDSTTFVTFYGIDLPFDYNGNIYQPIYDKWHANGLDDVLTQNAGVFDSIEVYIEVSDTNQFLFHHMAEDVRMMLDNNGINYSFDSYSGYEGYPAFNQRFVYDRLVEILKFHSRHLEEDM